MSEHVTVKEVSGGSPWKDLVYYDIVFDRNGSDFGCSWGKKSEGAPKIGDELEGEFFEKDGGEWGFRLAKGKGGPHTSSQPSSVPSSGPSDKDVAILAQTVLKAHLGMIELEGFTDNVQASCDRAHEWAIKKGQKASQGPGLGDLAVSTSAPDSPPAEPPAQALAEIANGDARQPLLDLLERGMTDPVSAEALADWMLSDEDYTEKVLNQVRFLLMEEGERSQAIERLRTAYEKKVGEVVPCTADKDVPF